MVADQFDHEIIGEDERQEYGDGCERSGYDRTPDLFCPFRYGLLGRFSRRRPPIHIFEHDDAVIEQHPDSKRHADESQAVGRDACRIEEVKSRIYGQGDRQGDEEHETDILQEKPEH